MIGSGLSIFIRFIDYDIFEVKLCLILSYKVGVASRFLLHNVEISRV